METSNIDEKSGRPLIEGKGMPIDGGIFRRPGHPGIVVDSSKFSKDERFASDMEAMFTATHRLGILNAALFFAESRIPVNEKLYKDYIKDPQTFAHRQGLSIFASKKDNKGREIGVGSPDAQALYTAFLIEHYLKTKDIVGKSVWVSKDPVDGHAIVGYRGDSGEYKFDPSKGDRKFKSLENPTL